MKICCYRGVLLLLAAVLAFCGKEEPAQPARTPSEYIGLPGDYQAGGIPDALAEDCLKIRSPLLDREYTGRFVLSEKNSFRFYEDEATRYGLTGPVSWDKEGLVGTFAVGKNAGSALTMDRSGYFLVLLNTARMAGSISKAGWEAIGDATPGGTETGTVMDYNPATELWSLTVVLKDGSMKFRKNGDWNEGDLGGSFDALTAGGDYIPVVAGTYDVVLDPKAGKATLTEQVPEPEPEPEPEPKPKPET